jgi:hypothetical protein
MFIDLNMARSIDGVETVVVLKEQLIGKGESNEKAHSPSSGQRYFINDSMQRRS